MGAPPFDIEAGIGSSDSGLLAESHSGTLGGSASMAHVQEVAAGDSSVERLPRRLSIDYLPLTAEPFVRLAHPRLRLGSMYLDRGLALAGGVLAQVRGTLTPLPNLVHLTRVVVTSPLRCLRHALGWWGI